ncbi:MAG: ribosome small subunit-dependent GTPase A [Bacilli bacterium]|nr:ribosome small subunit-dependent GTPase A [Bacilli bacterium]
MQGKVVSSFSNTYQVYSLGVNYTVLPKGVFRHQKKHVCVGDNVIIDDNNLTILDVSERKNELIRPKVSNVDQIFVTMSVKEPELSIELIYKFLTYINMNNIPAKLILTKIDLLDDLSSVNLLKNDLEKLGIEVFFVSNKDKNSIQNIVSSLDNKTSIFMGQTGVGKSSLINLIDPNYDRKIGSYSISRGRGKHQTKEVILLPFENGFIGDTPGFSALDLGIFKEDLAQFFPGYNSLYTSCFFSNCLHQNEKKCRVKEEVEVGNLSKNAYEIYLKLLNELPYRKERYNL